MPYIPPYPASLQENLTNLGRYKGDNVNRKKLLTLVQTVANHYLSSECSIAAMIFASEKIYAEYKFLSPQEIPYLSGYGPGSSLYTALQQALHISERNLLPDSIRIVYLVAFWNKLRGEGQLDVANTDYTCVIGLRTDILSIIETILQRSHPEIIVKKADTVASYLTYIPTSITTFLPGFAATPKPAPEVLTSQYVEALLSLPDTIIAPIQKDNLHRVAPELNVFSR